MRGRPRKSQIKDEDVQKIGNLYQSNWSLRDLADIFKTSIYQIKEVLFFLDIPLKAQGRPRKKKD